MEVQNVTVADIFTAAGSTLRGYMGLTTDFFNGLWANPVGQIAITVGIAGGAIGLCSYLFLRKRRLGH